VLDRVFSYDYDANDRLTQDRVITGTNPLGLSATRPSTFVSYGIPSSARWISLNLKRVLMKALESMSLVAGEPSLTVGDDDDG
jgi:hypothetical protein